MDYFELLLEVPVPTFRLIAKKGLSPADGLGPGSYTAPRTAVLGTSTYIVG